MKFWKRKLHKNKYLVILSADARKLIVDQLTRLLNRKLSLILTDGQELEVSRKCRRRGENEIYQMSYFNFSN